MDKDREKTLFNDLKPWFQILSVKFLAKFSGFNIFCWEFNYPGWVCSCQNHCDQQESVFPKWLMIPQPTSVQVNKSDWIRTSSTVIMFLGIGYLIGSIHSSLEGRTREERDSRGRRKYKLHCWSTMSWREPGQNSHHIWILINQVSQEPQDQNGLKVMRPPFKVVSR